MAGSTLDSVLAELLTQTGQAYIDAGPVNGVDRVPALIHLAPGREEAWDNCCTGQLYARVIEVYPSSPFPGRSNASGCGDLMAVRIGLGVLRCAAVLDNEGNAPSAEAMTGDTLEALEDMAILLDVLRSFSVEPWLPGFRLEGWVPKGVSGGCHGGEWTFALGVTGLRFKPDDE